MNSKRKKIATIPDSLHFASCKDVILWPELQQLISEFADAVRGQSREHLWSIEYSGEIRRKKGTRHSVSTIKRHKTSVFFETHNHPNPQNQEHAFLNPTDLSAAFLGPYQTLATAAMLLQVPDKEHLISARFKPKELHRFRESDLTGLDTLHRKIEAYHTTTSGPRFHNRVMRSQTIFEIADLYREEFSVLDFEIFEVDALKGQLKHRNR